MAASAIWIMAYNNNTMSNPHVNHSGLPLGRVVMRIVGSRNVGSSPTVGAAFFGDESRVCCGCGAGSPFRPSLFISPCKSDVGRGLIRMVLLLYDIIVFNCHLG